MDMNSLAQKTCVPCKSGAAALPETEKKRLLAELPEWEIVEDHHLSRTFKIPKYVEVLNWVNRIGTLAETEGHHPDMLVSWGSVRVDIWTHKIDNLTENDFILAAKIDQLAR